MKMIFNYDTNKTHFHNKGFALSLVLKVKFFGTRKWPIPFTGKRPRRPETGIKDDFEEIEHEVLFGISRLEKQRLPFQMFRCSRKFSAGTTKKIMFHLLSNRIFQNLFVNGK